MKRDLKSMMLAIVLLGLMVALLPDQAAAQRRGRGMERRSRSVAIGVLPRERARVLVGQKEFFYSRGIFYSSGPRGYLAVRAPIGAHIGALPVGYITVRMGAAPIFFYYGAYYQFDPGAHDYVVVNPPPDAGQQPGLDRLNLVDGRMISGTFMGGTASTVQIQVDGKVQEIPVDQIISIDFAPAVQ